MGDVDIEKPLDLEEVVKTLAQSMLDEDGKKKADLENPVVCWERMFVTHGKTEYTGTGSSPKPTAHVLFTANFSNDTPNPQRYTLRTERRTKSTCNIVLSKTYTIGASLGIKLTPPNPIIEANAGFHGEMSMAKGVNETFEQELAWTVDNEIQVPPGHMTRADLVIKEDEFDGDFSIKSTFYGEVVVRYKTKKQRDMEKRELVDTVVLGVKRLFNRDKGFEQDLEGRPVFVTRGKCKCRFGIEQNVLLKEMKLEQSEPN